MEEKEKKKELTQEQSDIIAYSVGALIGCISVGIIWKHAKKIGFDQGLYTGKIIGRSEMIELLKK